MGTNYRIESKDGITTIRFPTSPGLEDICKAIDEVVEKYPSGLRLWDFSHGLNLEDADLRKLGAYGKSKFLLPSKVAVVAPNDLAYGVARVHDVYRENQLLEQKIFRSEPEARAWLLGQKNPK